jgi:menaquinone-dependent protoporphyrinogen IX oxidase
VNTLVVYFSRKGYVKKAAQKAALDTNGDLYEIKTSERTEGIPGFWWCGRFNMHRWPMSLKGPDVDTSGYDKVIIYSPIWVFTVCAPVLAFVQQHAGKIKAVDYVFVHFSSMMKYGRTMDKLDSILGIHHDSMTSVMCMWGRIFKEKKLIYHTNQYAK